MAVVGAEGRLTMANENEGRTLSLVLADWWQRWRQSRNAVAELKACGSDVRQIADDLGLTPDELQVIAAKRPDAAGLLTARLAGLHLDPGEIAGANSAVLHDLQRLCTMCGSKARCARDLTAPVSPDGWQTYCPNASTLNALAAAADEEKAIARLIRRQSHRLNSLRSPKSI
jgi:uncharacterized protein YjiS (DUF1127 family)